MIRRRASAVIQLRDGFTGAVLGASKAVCTLDGVPMGPVRKEGGYLVFTDLTSGTHELIISVGTYRKEVLTLDAQEGHTIERTAALKPGVGYRFPAGTGELRLSVTQKGTPVAGETLWAAIPGRITVKLAQPSAAAGDTSMKVYCSGGAERLPIPGIFLLCDDKKPECVVIQEISDSIATLEAPLAERHVRGKQLIPAQRYQTDAQGQVILRFLGTGDGVLMVGKELKKFPLTAGVQELAWEWKGE